MLNPRIQKWFDDGYFKEALVGDGLFRIPDVTYREEHDLILVMAQLFEWAKQNHRHNTPETL